MGGEIKLTLTGYRADEVLPEESGEYAVTLDYGSHRKFWTLSYSAKHRAWNVHDHSTDEEVAKWRIDEVTHWFRSPEATEQKANGCCWCIADGVVNKVYIRTDDSEYTYVDAKFCPKCGRDLEDAE